MKLTSEQVQKDPSQLFYYLSNAEEEEKKRKEIIIDELVEDIVFMCEEDQDYKYYNKICKLIKEELKLETLTERLKEPLQKIKKEIEEDIKKNFEKKIPKGMKLEEVFNVDGYMLNEIEEILTDLNEEGYSIEFAVQTWK